MRTLDNSRLYVLGWRSVGRRQQGRVRPRVGNCPVWFVYESRECYVGTVVYVETDVSRPAKVTAPLP